MHERNGAQTFGGGFGGDIALGHGEHLVADHEFADGGRAQERRIEVGVQNPFGVRLAVHRGLVKAHRVGEGDFEQVVVAGGHLFENVGQGADFSGG